MDIQADNIPEELKSERRWCVWKYQKRSGKQTKIPYQPNGRAAKSNDPATWTDYDTAIAAAEKPGIAGVGFFLGDGWTGVDLDNCVADGQLEPWAGDIVRRVDSYWEVSPSGNGLKAFVRGQVPEGKNKRKIGEDGGIELYDRGRYFTVTGDHWPDTPDSVKNVNGSLAAVYRDYVASDIVPLVTDVKEECRGHLLTLPDSVEGDFGHNALLRAACEIRRWGFETEDAIELLHYFNDEKCYPLWDASELERKWSEACEKFEPDHTPQPGGPRKPGDAGPLNIQRLADVLERNDPTNGACLRPVIIDGMLRRGETMNFVGASKTNKSWTAGAIALSVALGRDFLGRSTSPCRVLILDNELHEGTHAFRLYQICQAMDVSPNDFAAMVDVVYLRGDLQPLSSLADSLKKYHASGGYGLLILDAMYRFIERGEEENSNSHMTERYNRLDDLARALDCGILGVVHTSKGNQSEKANTDTGAGAGAQSRACDAHVSVRPHEEDGCAVVMVDSRSFPPIEPIAVRWCWPLWQPDDSLDASRLLTSQAAKRKQGQTEDGEIMTAIIETLHVEGAMTVNGMKGVVDHPNGGSLGSDRLRRLCDRLVKDEALPINLREEQHGKVTHRYYFHEENPPGGVD